MSRNLTPRERELLIERVARELCWSDTIAHVRDSHRRHAVVVVDSLTRDATTSATLKRAIDRVIEGGLAKEGVA